MEDLAPNFGTVIFTHRYSRRPQPPLLPPCSKAGYHCLSSPPPSVLGRFASLVCPIKTLAHPIFVLLHYWIQQGPTSRLGLLSVYVFAHSCSSGLVLGRLPVAPPPKIGARPSKTTQPTRIHSPFSLHSDCSTTPTRPASIISRTLSTASVQSLGMLTRSSQETHRHFKPPPESVDNRFFVGPRSMSL